jgi:hypothetical protein
VENLIEDAATSKVINTIGSAPRVRDSLASGGYRTIRRGRGIPAFLQDSKLAGGGG